MGGTGVVERPLGVTQPITARTATVPPVLKAGAVAGAWTASGGATGWVAETPIITSRVGAPSVAKSPVATALAAMDTFVMAVAARAA